LIYLNLDIKRSS